MPQGTILMVEPNPGILIVARNVLTKAGLSVVAVSNPNEATELAAEESFSLAILDAAKSHFEIAEILRRRPEGPVPIVFTVAKGQQAASRELVERVRPHVPVEVIDKPFSPERLLSAVGRLVQGQEAPIEAELLPVPVAVTEPIPEDAFPFADLLQDEVDSMFHTITSDVAGPSNRIAAHLHEALARSEVHLTPRELDACVRACESALAAEALTDSGPMAVTGSLELLPIDQILQLAAHVDPPAQCRLEHAGAVIDVFYRGPRVVFARQDNLPPGFMLGSFLVAAQVVTEREVRSVLSSSSRRDGWIGQRLISAGLVRPDVVARALRRQTEELIYELVRWQAGRFRIFPQANLPAAATSAELDIPVEHLLLEGVRRLDEWRRISADIGNLEAVIAPLVEPSLVISQLPPADQHVLEWVDGERTVGEIVQVVARPSFEVFRSLHNLHGQNLVELRAG